MRAVCTCRSLAVHKLSSTKAHKLKQPLALRCAVFEDLQLRSRWSLDDMRRLLPDGLHGLYRWYMDRLVDALGWEAPDLLALLRNKLLPALVAQCEPLSVSELAWALAEPLTQVRRLRHQRARQQAEGLGAPPDSTGASGSPAGRCMGSLAVSRLLGALPVLSAAAL